MSLLGKTKHIATLVFVLVMGLQPLAAQSGRGSGGNPGSADTQVVVPPGAEVSVNPIFTGHVILADATPLPEPVAIERVCTTARARLGYTDAKGFFSFQLMQTVPALQDASESVREPFGAGGTGTPSNMNGFGTQPSGMVTGSGSGLASMSGCELRALLPGFQSTSVMIVPTGSLRTVDLGAIVLLKGQEQGTTVSATSMSAPKDARKAHDNAVARLRKQKLTEAQAELEKAVRVYPRYAAAWSKLGWLHEQQNRIEQAREAYLQAQGADDKFVPAYMGLASVAIRQSNWADAEKFSARATELDGVDFPLGFYYNALATSELGRLDQAEKMARLAEQLDVRHSLPQVYLLLGSLLAKKHDYAGAAAELKLYLKASPPSNQEKVRQEVARLEQLSTSADQTTGLKAVSTRSAPPSATEVQLATPTSEELIAVGNLSPPEISVPENWAPPDVDDLVPPVRPGVPCAVHEVLRGASMRVKQLMDNLQQFSATERIEHVRVDKKGGAHRPESATFKYVAQIREVKPGQLETQEYRDGSPSTQSFPARMVTTGMAAHALVLHPSVIDDLRVTCEGLGSVEGKPAWQLHFVQRPDRPPRFRQFHTGKGWFGAPMKGRAWVAADNYQVLRMETDLAKAIHEIALRKDHVIIDYRAVQFPKRHVELWLPETADLYLDLEGHRFHRRHRLSDFELFWVDVGEKTKDPVSPGG